MGLRPDKMMDRQRACIPRLQIEFLNTVILPTFKILAQIFPETSSFIDQIELNRNEWESQIAKERCKTEEILD